MNTLELNEYMWQLFWALGKSIEHDQVHLMDQATFSDFVSFIKKHTSPAPPPVTDDEQLYELLQEVTEQ